MFTLWQNTTCPRQVPSQRCCVLPLPKESSQYRTKSVSSISEDTAFLDTLTDQSAVSWQAQIELNGKVIQCKLDTGAEVTAISPDTYKSLHSVELHKSEKILSGPSRKALTMTGQFQGHFVYKMRTALQLVYVVDGLKTNLLGLPTITALNLAVRIDALTGVSEQNIHCKNKSVKITQKTG